MKILIAYASKYGSTRKCAGILKGKLNGEVDVVDLKDGKPKIVNYDAVIIGGPVYIGKLNKTVEEYCINNLPALVDMKIGFFLCHMEMDKPFDELIEKYYPKKLVETAAATGCFGGAFYVSKMNFLNRWMIKKSAGIEEDQEKILYDEIDKFAEKFNT
jgi:menaquinone-dependent protoporphyrinogen oxidase